MTPEERITVLEERVMWLQDLVEQLSTQMAAQEKRIMELETRAERSSKILSKLSEAAAPETVGAMPEDDPVPRSG